MFPQIDTWYIDKYNTDIFFWYFSGTFDFVKIVTSEREVSVLQSAISKATLGRLPVYLQFLRTVKGRHISAAAMARALGLGEVLVRDRYAAWFDHSGAGYSERDRGGAGRSG